jgi:hypothetical protein
MFIEDEDGGDDESETEMGSTTEETDICCVWGSESVRPSDTKNEKEVEPTNSSLGINRTASGEGAERVKGRSPETRGSIEETEEGRTDVKGKKDMKAAVGEKDGAGKSELRRAEDRGKRRPLAGRERRVADEMATGMEGELSSGWEETEALK